MIIDFGKTFGPIFRDSADLIKDVSVNATCNQTCAVRECFYPDAVQYGLNYYNDWWQEYIDLGFRRTCFENRCNCTFNIQAKKNTAEGRKELAGKIKKLQESLNNYNKKVV